MRQPDVQGKQLDQDGIPRRDWFEREECSLVFERENNGLFRSIRSCVATRAGLILVVGAWRQRGGLVWPPVRCSRAHHSHPAWSVLQHTPPAPWAGSGQALRPTPLHPPTPHPRARPRCARPTSRWHLHRGEGLRRSRRPGHSRRRLPHRDRRPALRRRGGR